MIVPKTDVSRRRALLGALSLVALPMAACAPIAIPAQPTPHAQPLLMSASHWQNLGHQLADDLARDIGPVLPEGAETFLLGTVGPATRFERVLKDAVSERLVTLQYPIVSAPGPIPPHPGAWKHRGEHHKHQAADGAVDGKRLTLPPVRHTQGFVFLSIETSVVRFEHDTSKVELVVSLVARLHGKEVARAQAVQYVPEGDARLYRSNVLPMVRVLGE